MLLIGSTAFLEYQFPPEFAAAVLRMDPADSVLKSLSSRAGRRQSGYFTRLSTPL